MKPLLTIGIPTRNRPAYLLEAVESAREQQCEVSFEVLVVDDASDDQRAIDCLQQLSSTNIRVARHQKRGGEGGSRNTIIQHMQGEFVVWLDDDDRLMPGALQSHLNRLSGTPDSDIIYGNLLLTDGAWKVQNQTNYQQIPPELLLHNLLFHDPIPNGGTMIRRSVFERVGPYDPSLTRGTDYHMWTRAAAASCVFSHHPELVYMYRSHTGNYQRGEDSPDFYPCMQKILDNLLRLAPLQRLFPMLPWVQDRKRAESVALSLVALAHMKCKAVPQALELSEQALRLMATTEAMLVYGLLLGAVGQSAEAFRLMSKVALAGNKTVRDLAGLCGLVT